MIINLSGLLILVGKESVPQDMAVVSFDNSYYSQIGSTPITSLCHKTTRWGMSPSS